MPRQTQLETCLLGIALGDSLGLPMEGMKAGRVAKMFRPPLRQRMVAGRGILSDDTLMAVATVQALFVAPDDVDLFARELAKRLRLWFWTIPPGIGLATLRSCLKLSVGFGPARSGVASAGNGAAVRAVVLGCALADDPEKRRRFIAASTRITHTHPAADEGAQLVGVAAALVSLGGAERFRAEAAALAPGWSWEVGYPPSGPTGWVVHTVNATIDCWERHPQDLAEALRMAIALGGDTDSVAALVGGIIGASGKAPDILVEWKRWIGWPQPSDLEKIASGASTRLPVERLLAQHAFAVCLIGPHLLRRVLPPY